MTCGETAVPPCAVQVLGEALLLPLLLLSPLPSPPQLGDWWRCERKSGMLRCMPGCYSSAANNDPFVHAGWQVPCAGAAHALRSNHGRHTPAAALVLQGARGAAASALSQQGGRCFTPRHTGKWSASSTVCLLLLLVALCVHALACPCRSQACKWNSSTVFNATVHQLRDVACCCSVCPCCSATASVDNQASTEHWVVQVAAWLEHCTFYVAPPPSRPEAAAPAVQPVLPLPVDLKALRRGVGCVCRVCNLYIQECTNWLILSPVIALDMYVQ
jgi:hypothetical protein